MKVKTWSYHSCIYPLDIIFHQSKNYYAVFLIKQPYFQSQAISMFSNKTVFKSIRHFAFFENFQNYYCRSIGSGLGFHPSKNHNNLTLLLEVINLQTHSGFLFEAAFQESQQSDISFGSYKLANTFRFFVWATLYFSFSVIGCFFWKTSIWINL